MVVGAFCMMLIGGILALVLLRLINGTVFSEQSYSLGYIWSLIVCPLLGSAYGWFFRDSIWTKPTFIGMMGCTFIIMMTTALFLSDMETVGIVNPWWNAGIGCCLAFVTIYGIGTYCYPETLREFKQEFYHQKSKQKRT
jgi:hypothetical protein